MNIKKNWNKIIERIKIKWNINDEVILRYEVGILLTILVFSVTIAWMFISSSAEITGLSMTTAQLDPFLVISNSDDGVDVGEHTEIALAYKNGQDKMMPGTEGTLTMYLSANRKDVSGCTIYLKDLIPTFDDDISDAVQDSMEDEIKRIISHHILFYYPDPDNASNIYKNQITKDSGYKVSLLPGEKNKEVTLYWIWPYSYKDIPNVDVPDDEQKEKIYDLEDSKIGGYVKKIAFQLDFESVITDTP